MTDERNTMGEPERTDPPPRRRRPQPRAQPGPSDERDDAATDERTSPFPYAERFDQWVADETTAPDGQQHRQVTGDTDS
jgi:hypothetical protein